MPHDPLDYFIEEAQEGKCNANIRMSEKRFGKKYLCGKVAGEGTPHVGEGKCYLHGGLTPKGVNMVHGMNKPIPVQDNLSARENFLSDDEYNYYIKLRDSYLSEINKEGAEITAFDFTHCEIHAYGYIQIVRGAQFRAQNGGRYWDFSKMIYALNNNAKELKATRLSREGTEVNITHDNKQRYYDNLIELAQEDIKDDTKQLSEPIEDMESEAVNVD